MEVLIRYMCFNCESIMEQYENIEELEIHLPVIEKWNICPECIKQRDRKRE